MLLLLLLSGGRGPELKGAAKPGLGFGLELGMVAISVDRLELSDGIEQAKFSEAQLNGIKSSREETSESEAGQLGQW